MTQYQVSCTNIKTGVVMVVPMLADSPREAERKAFIKGRSMDHKYYVYRVEND